MVRLGLILTRLRFVKSMREPDPQRGSAASGVSWSGAKPHRRLVPLGRGTVIFTGASASLRGRPGYAQFAAAKAGLRMIAQSMAREYGPQGIHVAHVIIDGGIDGERLRAFRPQIVEERGEALAASAGALRAASTAAAPRTPLVIGRRNRIDWGHMSMSMVEVDLARGTQDSPGIDILPMFAVYRADDSPARPEGG